MNSENARRMKLFCITEQAVIDRFKSGRHSYFISAGLPSDSMVTGAEYDLKLQSWKLRVWSSEFGVIPEGSPIPEIGSDIDCLPALPESPDVGGEVVAKRVLINDALAILNDLPDSVEQGWFPQESDWRRFEGLCKKIESRLRSLMSDEE